jgi:hypothetical protein
MKKLAAALLLVFFPLLARAQSTIEGLPPVATFPLPDSSTTPQHLWMTQGCATLTACDYKVTPEQTGYIFQGPTPPATPFVNQLWWNTSASPAILQAFQNGAWSPVTSRIRLTANGNLYVAPSGADTGNGCANVLAPCLTIQHAADVALRNYDAAGYTMYINLAPTGGTPYTAGASIFGSFTGFSLAQGSAGPGNEPNGNLVFLGNPGNPDSVVINIPGAGTAAFLAAYGASIVVQGVNIIIPNGYGLFSDNASTIQWANVDFGAANTHVAAQNSGGAQAIGNYTISGGAAANHLLSVHGGIFAINPGVAVTLIGTPSFGAFVQVASAAFGFIPSSVTFTGSAVGRSFIASNNSVFQIGNAAGLPGSLPGATVSGGITDPPQPLASVSNATGLGVGGGAIANPPNYAGETVASIVLSTGPSGTAASGSVDLNFSTKSFRICVGNPSSGFTPGSTIMFGAPSGDETLVATLEWTNAGVPLTTNANYSIDFICQGTHI